MKKVESAVYWGRAAAGILFTCREDGTVLLLHRSPYVEQPGTWGTPGGAVSDSDDQEGGDHDTTFYDSGDESAEPRQYSDAVLWRAAEQETEEELGSLPRFRKTGHVDYRDGSFLYRTHYCDVTADEKARWTKTIRFNWENDDAQWFGRDDLPPGLHFGFTYLMKKRDPFGSARPSADPVEAAVDTLRRLGRPALARRLVRALIAVPPRDMKAWLLSIRRRFGDIETRAKSLMAELTRIKNLPDEAGIDIATDLYRYRWVLDDAENYLKRLGKSSTAALERVAYPIQCIENGWRQNLGQAVDHLHDFSKTSLDSSGYRDFSPKTVADFSSDFGRNQERVNDYLDMYRNEPAAAALDGAMTSLEPLGREYLEVMREVDSKLGAVVEERRYAQDSAWRGRDADRRAKGVQPLYHATAFKTEILRDGWLKDPPLDRTGLGYMGGQAEWISFSYDLQIAKDAARTMKEVVDVVNGRISEREIMSWLEHEGFDRETVLKELAGLTSLKPGSGPAYTLALYNWYLWNNKVGRSNPVLTDQQKILRTFRGRSARDVGVLQCEVDLDHPDVTYHPGEREFRAPSAAIVSTKALW